jgi:hypothetical protein
MNFTTPGRASHAFAATLIDAAVNRRDWRTTKRQSFERAALPCRLRFLAFDVSEVCSQISDSLAAASLQTLRSDRL